MASLLGAARSEPSLQMSNHKQSFFANDSVITAVKLALRAMRHLSHDHTDHMYCLLHVIIDLLLLVLAGMHVWLCFVEDSESPNVSEPNGFGSSIDFYRHGRHLARAATPGGGTPRE